MPKKDKKASKAKDGEGTGAKTEEAAPAATEWTCGECGQENEPTDDVCCACEEPRPQTSADDPYHGYLVGLIVSAEAVPKKDKLTVVEVDIGADDPLKIVTNAPNAKIDTRVVVATIGSKYRGESGEDEVVQKGAVGGVTSHGMLCNGPMLGWKGGDNKMAATLPEDFPVGSRPPESRPRKDV